MKEKHLTKDHSSTTNVVPLPSREGVCNRLIDEKARNFRAFFVGFVNINFIATPQPPEKESAKFRKNRRGRRLDVLLNNPQLVAAWNPDLSGMESVADGMESFRRNV